MYHPDIDKSDIATQRMQFINLAYEGVSDPAKRREYDNRTGTSWDTLTPNQAHSNAYDYPRRTYTKPPHSPINTSPPKDEILIRLENNCRGDPSNYVHYLRLAEAYLERGRRRDAISQYDVVGELILEQGLNADAIEIIEKIVSLSPSNANGYIELLSNLKRGY